MMIVVAGHTAHGGRRRYSPPRTRILGGEDLLTILRAGKVTIALPRLGRLAPSRAHLGRPTGSRRGPRSVPPPPASRPRAIAPPGPRPHPLRPHPPAPRRSCAVPCQPPTPPTPHLRLTLSAPAPRATPTSRASPRPGRRRASPGLADAAPVPRPRPTPRRSPAPAAPHLRLAPAPLPTAIPASRANRGDGAFTRVRGLAKAPLPMAERTPRVSRERSCFTGISVIAGSHGSRAQQPERVLDGPCFAGDVASRSSWRGNATLPTCCPSGGGSGRPYMARRQRRSAGSVGRLSGEFAENFGSFGNTERRRDAVASRGARPR